MKSLLTLICSDNLETVSSEKATLVAQQNLWNSFADFLIYIICHILSLVSKTGGRYYVLEMLLSLSLPSDTVPKQLAYHRQLSHRWLKALEINAILKN